MATAIISLGELFTENEIKKCMDLIKEKKDRELKEYLNSPVLKKRMLEKEVLVDYLYFQLLYLFR